MLELKEKVLDSYSLEWLKKNKTEEYETCVKYIEKFTIRHVSVVEARNDDFCPQDYSYNTLHSSDWSLLMLGVAGCGKTGLAKCLMDMCYSKFRNISCAAFDCRYLAKVFKTCEKSFGNAYNDLMKRLESYAVLVIDDINELDDNLEILISNRYDKKQITVFISNEKFTCDERIKSRIKDGIWIDLKQIDLRGSEEYKRRKEK